MNFKLKLKKNKKKKPTGFLGFFLIFLNELSTSKDFVFSQKCSCYFLAIDMEMTMLCLKYMCIQWAGLVFFMTVINFFFFLEKRNYNIFYLHFIKKNIL